MVTEEDLILSGKHTIQYTGDILYNCTLETYIILLTNITTISLINFLKFKKDIICIYITSVAIQTC